MHSAASKIPAMGNTAMNVFNSAWRLSAIKEDSSENKNIFFFRIFELFSLMLIVVTQRIISDILAFVSASKWIMFIAMAVIIFLWDKLWTAIWGRSVFDPP